MQQHDSSPAKLAPAEQLLRNFYLWEQRGRGWQCFPFPVQLEPPFTPFPGHFLSGSPTDDGQHPSLLASVFNSLFGTPARTQSILPEPSIESEVRCDDEQRAYVELQLALPHAADYAIADFEAFLVGLSACRSPLAFELVGTSQNIIVQLAVEQGDEAVVVALLRSYLPDIAVNRTQANTANIWSITSQQPTLAIEYALDREFMLPLATYANLQTDLHVGLVAAMSLLQTHEACLFQVLFRPVHHAWSQSMLRAVTCPDGSDFFDAAPAVLKQTKQKVSRPLFAAGLRVVVSGASRERTLLLARTLHAALSPLDNPEGNGLIPLAPPEEFDVDLLGAVLSRRNYRPGMILNSAELASLAHIPTSEVVSSQLSREHKTTKAAPSQTRDQPMLLGINDHHGIQTIVGVCTTDRLKHMHIIGASGTGKSTLLLNMMLQDVTSGHGLALLDPHGDLVDAVIARLPSSRRDDVILLDPADSSYLVGFNILQAHSDLEKNLLASDLVGLFRRFSTSWGDQMNAVLANAVLAILESTRGGSLADLRRFLIEPDFRNEFLETVTDPHVVYYWHKEFPLLSGRPQATILTRLDTFLRPKVLRNMVAHPRSDLDFGRIMDDGKILLCKLSHGSMGQENAYLLGALLVSKFHLLVMGRQQTAASSRRPFFLYLDEFQHFVTPSMATLLSGARKYALGLVLAHQNLAQLAGSEDLSASLAANAHTVVSFRLSDDDAKKFEGRFHAFSADDLKMLGTGEAICRIGRSDHDFNLKSYPTPHADDATAQDNLEAVMQAMRERYPMPASVPIIEPPPKNDPPLHAPDRKPNQPVAPQPMPPIVPPPLTPVSGTLVKRPIPAEAMPLGKGSRDHKYLQELIARFAQGFGYRTTIEAALTDGTSIDVLLEQGQQRIACEISISTSIEHELQNLAKSLSAGITHIFMLSRDERFLKRLQKAATEAYTPPQLASVRFMTPEALLAQPELLTPASPSQETVRGYKVNVKLQPVTPQTADAKKQVIAAVLAKALRK